MTPVLVLLLAAQIAASPAAPRAQRSSRAATVSQAAPTNERAPALLTWSELVSQRSARLGQRVRLRVQLDARIERWEAYLTRFGPGEFAALSAWDDGQFPWDKADYDAPAVRFFVRRGGALELALASAPRYRRYEIEVVVRELFREEPWVELVALQRLERSLDEASLIHASRARLLLDNGSHMLALEELDRALAGDLPRPARRELERLRAQCRELAHAGR